MCFLFLQPKIVPRGLPLFTELVQLLLHSCHLLLKLLGLLLFLLLLALLLFLLLLLLLSLSKLVEDVLVVQDGVGELIFEILVVQEGLSTSFDDVKLQYLVDRWALSGVLVEHHSKQVRYILTKMARYICILSCNNFLG